jgi:hypothetical protein
VVINQASKSPASAGDFLLSHHQEREERKEEFFI